MRCLVHVLWRDSGYIGQMMLKMKLSGRKKKEKPQRRFMDVVKKDMLTTDLTEDASDEVRVKQMTPKGSNRKKKTGFKHHFLR